MVFLKSTKTTCLCTPIVAACDTATYNTANSSLKFFKITVARLHPLLKIVQISSRKLNISQYIQKKKPVSFDVSAVFTSIPVPAALQVITSKISNCTGFTNVCKIPTEKIPQASGVHYLQLHFCFNKKFYKQLQGAVMGLPASPVIANIYMEYFKSLAIPTSSTSSNGTSGMLMMSTVPSGKSSQQTS